MNKEEEFKREFSKSLSGEDKEAAEDQIESFFELELRQGFNRLQEFLDALHGRLAEGETLTLVIKGHASPKYTSNYNKRLSLRRISSVKNELRSYKAGLMAQYIDTDRLIIREESYGEDLSSPTVSDSQEDRRASVYSPEASRERKADILKVESPDELN